MMSAMGGKDRVFEEVTCLPNSSSEAEGHGPAAAISWSGSHTGGGETQQSSRGSNEIHVLPWLM